MPNKQFIITLAKVLSAAAWADGKMDKTVGDNMTVGVVSLYHDEPLIHAIRKFEKLKYGRFPVLDRDTGKLVGILTKGDIIKCLLQKFELS